MVNVIGVRFQNAGKLYFFDPGNLWPTPGDFVVVETARGMEFGEVVTAVQETNDEQLSAPLRKVVRIASAQDVRHNQENKAAEKDAYAICQRKIAEHKLDMKLVSVEYTFDNSKILFYFTANGRVDFRSLVKDLASVFKTRIELRQIGVRDEAKMLGGLGPCGRPICCGAFLGDFQPVSIKMAKEQNLSLNPIKISGVCGRLMCCLKYEEDHYEQTRKRMPRVGREVITPDGSGVVCDLNIIKETVRVRIQKGDSSEMRDYPLDVLQKPGAPSAAPQETPEAPKEAAETVEAPAGERAPEAESASTPNANGTERPEKAEKFGKRPPRPQRGEERPRNAQRDGKLAQAEAGAAERKVAPAAAPAQIEMEKPVSETATESRPTAPEKPAPNAWKQALERAMRAARGEEEAKAPKAETAPMDQKEAPTSEPAVKENAPIQMEDHQEMKEPALAPGEDDIL